MKKTVDPADQLALLADLIPYIFQNAADFFYFLVVEFPVFVVDAFQLFFNGFDNLILQGFFAVEDFGQKVHTEFPEIAESLKFIAL